MRVCAPARYSAKGPRLSRCPEASGSRSYPGPASNVKVVPTAHCANDSRNAAWLSCRDDVGGRKDALGRSGRQQSQKSFCHGGAHDDAHEFPTVFAERSRHGFEWKFPVDVAKEVFERARRASYGRRRYREVGRSVHGLSGNCLGHISKCKLRGEAVE